MPAPTKYPDWATDGTNTVEPPAGKVAAGWLPAEQPPAGWFNWWQALVGTWTRWLDGLITALTGRVTTLEADMGAVESTIADAAHKSQNNTFTASNTFTHSIVTTTPDPEEALFVSNQTAGDFATKWRLVSAFRQSVAAAGVYRYARMYTGDNAGDTEGALVIAVNAVWNKTAAQWQKDYAPTDSTALIWHRGKIRISRVAANAAPWASWPTGLSVGATGANLVDALVEGEFGYTATKTRTTFIPIWSGFGAAGIAGAGGAQGLGTGAYHLQFYTNNTDHVFPVCLPQGATLISASVLVKMAIAGPNMAISLLRRFHHNFETAMTLPAGTNAIEQELLAAPATWGAGAGVFAMSVTPGTPVTIDNRAEDSVEGSEYLLRVNGNANDEIHAVRITWTDPGPRNH